MILALFEVQLIVIGWKVSCLGRGAAGAAASFLHFLAENVVFVFRENIVFVFQENIAFVLPENIVVAQQNGLLKR